MSLKENVCDFSFDYTAEDKFDISMVKYIYKIFGFFLKNVYWIVSFSGYLAFKCIPLNNKQCKTRTFLLDLNLIELKY